MGLLHFPVTGAVLCRDGCGAPSGIAHPAFTEQQILGPQRGADGGKNVNAQVLGFKQLPLARCATPSATGEDRVSH